MENENPRVPPLWELSLTTLLGHDPTSDPGIALRQWVHFQGVHIILDLLSWDQDELKTIASQQVYSLNDHGQGLYLRANQIKQICGLITYMKHIFGSYSSGIAHQDDQFLENHLCSVNFKNYELFNLLLGFSPLGIGFSTLQNPKQVICPLHAQSA